MFLVIKTTDRIVRQSVKAKDYDGAKTLAEQMLHNLCCEIKRPELYDSYCGHKTAIIVPETDRTPSDPIVKTLDWKNQLTGIHVNTDAAGYDIYIISIDDRPPNQVNLLEPLYTGDSLEYAVSGPSVMDCYEIAPVTVTLINTGEVTWSNRTLRFIPPARLCPRPVNKQAAFLLPKTKPGCSCPVTFRLDARGGEGDFSLRFVMEDYNGQDCFPYGPNPITFPVKVKFRYQPD